MQNNEIFDISYAQSNDGCFRDYIITLNKPCTVKEFIDYILEHNPKEWGYFGIYSVNNQPFGDPHCEYAYGKLKSQLPESYLNQNIIRVSGNGGYTRSDYIFVTESTKILESSTDNEFVKLMIGNLDT